MSFNIPASSSVGTTTGLNVGSGNILPITFAYWVRASAAATTASPAQCAIYDSAFDDILAAPVVNWGGSGDTALHAYHQGSGQYASKRSSTVTVLNNAWHHVMVVFPVTGSPSASNIELYLDGTNVSAGIVQTGNPAYAFTAPLHFYSGESTGGTPVFKIAEIGIWAASLTSSDATSLAVTKNAPELVQNSTLRHYWSLWDGHTSGGINDRKGTTNLGVNASAATSSDHPSGIIRASTGTAKYDIPTTATDGTARKLFVWSDTTLATLVITNQTVTASGGHFKHADASATLAVAKPAVLASFGADEFATAQGGACWATGIFE